MVECEVCGYLTRLDDVDALNLCAYHHPAFKREIPLAVAQRYLRWFGGNVQDWVGRDLKLRSPKGILLANIKGVLSGKYMDAQTGKYVEVVNT